MAVAIFCNLTSKAATVTFNGNTSNSWTVPGNWSTNSVPGNGDDVIIGTGKTVTLSSGANVSVKSLTLSGTLTNSNKTITAVDIYVESGGVFNGNANVISTTFTLNGGTFTAGTITFTVSSSLIINSGSTLNLSSATAINVADIDATNGGTVSLKGSAVTFAANSTFDINGSDLTIATDTLVVPSSVTVNFNSGSIDLNNIGMRVMGNFNYNGGTFTSNGLLTANNYTIDITGTLVLGHRLRILNNLTFTSGMIQSSGRNLVTFDHNATASGVSNTAHINGPVRKEISSTNTTPDFTFPIGNGTFYAPIVISNFAGRNSADSFTAQYFKVSSANASGSLASGLGVVSTHEYWTLNRTSSGTAATTASVNISYNSSRSGIIKDASQLLVARWNGSQWLNLGRANTSSTSNTNGTLTTLANTSGFGQFTLGSQSFINPLPVHLLNFAAIALNTEVAVKWSTANEINSDIFAIEKSLDGKIWFEIGSVEAAGHSNAVLNYTFTDVNPVAGIQYYRLKQLDIDGKFTYSSIAPVKFAEALQAQVNIFPQPANNELNVSVAGASEFSIAITNINGQKVFESHSDSNILNINLSNFDSGVYTLNIVSNNVATTTKFIKY